MTGCTKITEGCDHCYAEVVAERFAGGPAFPDGFAPQFKPKKLTDPARAKEPKRWFVNSMSDIHHEAFTTEQVDQVYDAMAATERHDYLVLTKRPQRMRAYLTGRDGWLARRDLEVLPPQIWVGATIELDKYCFRANHLRAIPALVRFLSCEPLLGPLPRLDLDGLAWVIVGGESGNGSRNFRPMDHAWAVDLRDRCAQAGVAFYFKQSAAPVTEMGQLLEGRRHEEYPLAHPSRGKPRELGIYRDTDPIPRRRSGRLDL